MFYEADTADKHISTHLLTHKHTHTHLDPVAPPSASPSHLTSPDGELSQSG